MGIKEIYKKVKGQQKAQLLKCYKKEVIEVIKGDRDKLLELKADCDKRLDIDGYNNTMLLLGMVLAIASSVMSIITIEGNGVWNFRLFSLIVLLYFLLVIPIISISHKKNIEKYILIKIIIDDIDNNWELYFSSNIK